MSLQLAKEFVNKTYTKNACTGYTLLLSGGGHSGNYMTNCYGSIGRVSFTGKPIAVVNQLQTNYLEYYESLPEGTPKAYLSWVVNDSVFADTFFEKDVDKILEEGIWVTRCDIPGNLMVAAMTCVRALTEGDRSCRSGEVFLPLLRAGCTPEFAFVLGHFMSGNTLRTDNHDSNHCVFDWGNLTIGTVVNFCKKKITTPRKKNWCDEKQYDGVHNLFCSNDYVSFSKWLVNTYKKFSGGVKEIEQTVVNPFSSAIAQKGSGLTMNSDKFAVMGEVCALFYEEFVK